MHRHQLSKEFILKHLNDGKDVAVEFRSLTLAFGFERKTGVEILLTQLIFPSKTEEQIQTLSPLQCRTNIKTWCNENKILLHHDYTTDRYYFKKP